MMEVLDIHFHDVEDIVRSHDNGQMHSWEEEILEALEEKVLPELCDLTADNCTLYNSYLLDCNCVEELEQMSSKCRGMKCDISRHIMEHGPRLVGSFLQSSTVAEAVEIVRKEFRDLVTNHDLCKCGRELFRALFKCAKFYDGNYMKVQMGCYDSREVQTWLRNLDLESASMVVDKLLHGMCEKSKKGKSQTCFDSVFEPLKEVASMVDATLEEHNAYTKGTEKQKQRYEENCDMLFGPLKAWDEAASAEYFEFESSESGWRQLFEKSSAFMENLYCKWPCKSGRGTLYPCCLKRILSDESIYSHLEKLIYSIYRIPSTTSHWVTVEFAKLENWFSSDLDNYLNYKIPEDIKEKFRSTIHPAKFCSGRTFRCSN